LITKKNLPQHEFIGLRIEIMKSRNKTQTGLKGKVIDETQKTIKMETKNGEKTVQKSGSLFRFTLPNGKKTTLKGDAIVARPEDRIKKKFKEWDII